jgi:hypothetical protein
MGRAGAEMRIEILAKLRSRTNQKRRLHLLPLFRTREPRLCLGRRRPREIAVIDVVY